MTRAGATAAAVAILAVGSAHSSRAQLGSIPGNALPSTQTPVNQSLSPQPIDGPLGPLIVLADTRASGLWLGVTTRIGTTLPQYEAVLRQYAQTLRTALTDGSVPRSGIMRARANDGQWTGVNPQVEVRRQLARTLAVFDRDAAIAELAAAEADPSIGNGDAPSRVRLYIAHAGLLAHDGRSVQALDVLARAGARFPPGSGPGINVDVNAAAIAVESGGPRLALTLLDRAGDPYTEHLTDRTAEVLATGAVQYNWIRACAYQQLGRIDEAANLLRAFAVDPAAIPGIRMRTALCVGDADMLAGALAQAMRTGVSEEALQLQPARIAAATPRRQALLGGVRARPEIAALYDATQRDLPAEYAPIIAQGEPRLR